MKSPEEKPGRGRPKTLNKAAVTEVAMHAYWSEGPTRVSLNELCQRAGVSKPSVYREFGNEDGLAHAALTSYGETVLGKMLAIVTSDQGFSNKIGQIVYLAAQDPLHESGCLFVKMRAAKDQMGPKTQILIDQIEGMAQGVFAQALAEGRASGVWTSAIPIDLAARYLHAQIGLALDQRARGEDPTDILDLALSALGLSGA